MGLTTKPGALTGASRIIYTLFNNLYDDLYDLLGNTVNGRGSLTYENLSPTANLAHDQIANDAAVLGGGATQAMQNPFVQTAPRLDLVAGNAGTLANSATPALIAGKLIQFTGGTTTITNITGGVEGQEIILTKIHAVTVQQDTTDNIATATAGRIHLKLKADNAIVGTAGEPICIRLRCSKLGGTFTNLQWFEI